jgi:transcriptional regulator with XRE-family HTH domain
MLNEQIRRLRKKAGFSQVAFAEKMNVSQSTIASWENGTRRPDLDAILKMAELFHVSTDDILGRQQSRAEEEIWELRELLRRDPERHVLFSFARNAKIEDVRRAVAVIDALKKTSDIGADSDDPA